MAIIEKPLNPFTIANELGYYEYAPHPVTGQTVRKVDWGRMCTHANINKWSKYKPVKFSSVEELTETQWMQVYNGSLGESPTGGADSPFRISDFSGYNHDAIPPVKVEIVSVNGNATPPFKIYKDEYSLIVFRLLSGDINPSWIDSRTVREKKSGVEAGYGGLSWIGEGSNPMLEPVERSVDNVFGTGFLVEYQQNVFCSVLPRVEYMYWLGSAANRYDNRQQLEIMDESYKTLFQLTDMGLLIDFTAQPLFWNRLSQKLEARTRITNNSGGILYGYRISVRYTINIDMPIPGENHDRFGETDTFNLDEGLNTPPLLELQYISQNDTFSYKVYYYLERYLNNQWNIVTETMIIQDVSIPPSI